VGSETAAAVGGGGGGLDMRREWKKCVSRLLPTPLGRRLPTTPTHPKGPLQGGAGRTSPSIRNFQLPLHRPPVVMVGWDACGSPPLPPPFSLTSDGFGEARGQDHGTTVPSPGSHPELRDRVMALV
jgi:hypothetical protein